MRRAPLLLATCILLAGCTSDEPPPSSTSSPVPQPSGTGVSSEPLTQRAQERLREAKTFTVSVQAVGAGGEAIGTKAAVRYEPCTYTIQDVAGRTSFVQGDVVVEDAGGDKREVINATTGGVISAILLPDGLCQIPSLLASLDLQSVAGEEGIYTGKVSAQRLRDDYEKRLVRARPDQAQEILDQLEPTITGVAEEIDYVAVALQPDGAVKSIAIHAADLIEQLDLTYDAPAVDVTLPTDYAPLP